MTHPFSHIAPGPYRFIGTDTAADRAADQADRAAEGLVFTTNPSAGTCDHCGTGIMIAFRFEAADGTRFKVGSTCVGKADKAIRDGCRCDLSIRRAMKAKKAANKVKRHAREAAKLAEAEAWIGEHRDELATMPHPRGFSGTLLDNINWMWSNAGTAGKLKTYKAATAALAA